MRTERALQHATTSLFLDAVVVPTRLAETPEIERNLRLWAEPGFQPTLAPRHWRPKLIFIFNNGDLDGPRAAIARLFEELGLDRHFSAIEFFSLALAGLEDLYSRSGTGVVGPNGYKAGPNNQFFHSMDICTDLNGPVFYMETDCIPIRAGWLDQIQQVIDARKDAFIVGSTYKGAATLGAEFHRHVNGNALYYVSSPGFAEFLQEWRTWLRHFTSGAKPDIAYDIAIESIFYIAPFDEHAREFFRRYGHKVQSSNFIQNISADADDFAVEPHIVQEVRRSCPETALLHGRVFSRAATRLLETDGPHVPDRLLVEPAVMPAGSRRRPRRSIAARSKSVLVRQLRRAADWIEGTRFSRLLSPRGPRSGAAGNGAPTAGSVSASSEGPRCDPG